jgi:hypothetical protein
MDLYTDIIYYIEIDPDFEETEELKTAREYID